MQFNIPNYLFIALIIFAQKHMNYSVFYLVIFYLNFMLLVKCINM